MIPVSMLHAPPPHDRLSLSRRALISASPSADLLASSPVTKSRSDAPTELFLASIVIPRSADRVDGG